LVLGHVGRRDEGIVAQHHRAFAAIKAQGQFKPVLNEMFLLDARPPHHALRGLSRLKDVAIGGKPVVALVAPVEFVKIAPGGLAIIDVAQSGAGKADAAALGLGLVTDETNTGEEPWKMPGADVGAIGIGRPAARSNQ